MMSFDNKKSKVNKCHHSPVGMVDTSFFRTTPVQKVPSGYFSNLPSGINDDNRREKSEMVGIL